MSALLSTIGYLEDRKLKNWSQNYTYSVDKVYLPKTIEEIQELIKHFEKLRVLGTRHTFHGLADSSHHLISMASFDKVLHLDKESKTVTVEAGITYAKLAVFLHENGYALHNLASLPHISVAGACATATHGSGLANSNLATAVTAMEVVTANGEVVEFSRDKNPEEFAGAVVHLGGIGVVTKLTLKIEPDFSMKQKVFVDMPMEVLRENFVKIMSAGYSVSLFTKWQDKVIDQVWIKWKADEENQVEFENEYYGAKQAEKNYHPIAELTSETCTEQMSVIGTWYDRLPHFRIGFTPGVGDELQTEYFVPLEHAYEAICAVETLHAEIEPYIWITEIRTIAADDLWMSMNYKRPSVAIHFTWKNNWEEVQKLMRLIEEKLAPFEPRPHWGKCFSISHESLRKVYEKLPEFQRLLEKYDPKGKFRNEFLDTFIFEK